ncbi:response regulator transcription factor [Gorillibacterium sp. sgz5001074]|uniref:response regulator transcription factor n=1 Tax=Gorillibacterium sp. sgz5001074 TaxID=3446695 RepID=UPI003F670B7B
MIRLMIVDDEKKTREGLEKHLPWRRLGIDEVRLAKSGTEALELARSHPPDILLCDVRMPRMDGIELATVIRHQLPSCKLIFLSGFADKEYLKSAIQLRALRYIEKPVDMEEVCSAITEAVTLLHREESSRHEVVDGELHKPADKEITNLKVIQIIRYINDQYHDPSLSIQSIAGYADMNASYLSTFFKKETGQTLNDFINETRIERAKQLLRSSPDKLYKVAELTGFTDSTYFATIFKKYAGCTPTQYRSGASN